MLKLIVVVNENITECPNYGIKRVREREGMGGARVRASVKVYVRVCVRAFVLTCVCACMTACLWSNGQNGRQSGKNQ